MSRAVLWAVSGLVIVFLLAPVLIIIPMSFGSALSLEFPPRSVSLQWYRHFFSSGPWLDAARVSLVVAAGAAAVSAVLGTLASFALVRGRFPGRDLIYLLILSPLVIPGVVVAIGMYLFLGRLGLVGSISGLIIAHTAIALPLVVVNMTAALQGFDRSIERAAMSAGANRLRTFWHVTLPVIRPGFTAGVLFAFMASFDEVIIAIFLSGRNATTLPKRMWDSVLLETDPTISAVSSLLVGATILTVVLGVLLTGRRRA